MKKKRPSRAKVIKLTPRRREAMKLEKFIDAHGGRLGAMLAPGQRVGKARRSHHTCQRAET